jgi:hypothetical protein
VRLDQPQSPDLVKVTIDLNDDVYEVETLWAATLAAGLYRLRNVPFLAYGYSADDMLNAAHVYGRLMVSGVAQCSGHSTYRVLLPAPEGDEEFAPLWEPLARLGCTYGCASARLIGIYVPPKADLYAVYAVLERGEQANQWSFEERHCGHPLRNLPVRVTPSGIRF